MDNKDLPIPDVGEEKMAIRTPSKSYGIRTKAPDLTIDQCKDFCDQFERDFISNTSAFEAMVEKLKK